MESIHSYASIDDLTQALFTDFYNYVQACPDGQQVNIVISGGETPAVFFDRLSADGNNHSETWNRIHLFWADERCVPPDHPDSNYGMARKRLLQGTGMSEYQVHRIHGENDPDEETTRYTGEIIRQVDTRCGIPVFDRIYLGLGEDGHTASIFPDNMDLLKAQKICAVARHPVTGQNRITLTGPVLMQAKRITFMATGESKSRTIGNILNHNSEADGYPAAYIKPRDGTLDWYLDESASRYIQDIRR
jgi:6-phosphogluconolactonase